MIIKKFQANSETEAILLAKEDLGKDAIVMNIKTMKPKAIFKIFRKTRVEVTAAVDEINNQGAKQESTASMQFNAQIDEKLHPEMKQESESVNETKEIEEKLNSLAMLIEQQMESQKKEKQSSNEMKEEIEPEKEEKEEKTSAKNEKAEEDGADEEKNSLKNKSIDLIIEQLTNNEVSLNYAQQIMDEITHSGNIRTLDEMLSCVYQKIILKLGEMKPISFEKRG